MIKIEDLNVRIGHRKILSDINIEIEDGKWTCLVGPNGAGKTTLLKSLLGSQAYSGSITDSGVEVFKNHAPIVSSLETGKVRVTTAKGVEYFQIDSGVIEVFNNKVALLAETILK